MNWLLEQIFESACAADERCRMVVNWLLEQIFESLSITVFIFLL